MPTGRRISALAALALVATLLAGCQLTQSAFARTAANAGAAFAAAAVTLRDVHSSHITTAYAASSFVNFRAELKGVDTRLPSASGAPDSAHVKRLLALYAPAMRAVEYPCLDTSCDWQGQIRSLVAASDALLKAASP